MACLHHCFVYFCSFRLWKGFQDRCIALYTKINELLTDFESDFAIVFLSFEPSFIDKFDEPLYDWKDIVNIKTLQLERLKVVRGLHVFKGRADMLWDFDFLSDLHLIIVVNVDLEVGWSNAPSNSANNFVEGF